jgi:hypothetical protein
MLIMAAMLRNMIAETRCASVPASLASPKHVGNRLLGLKGEGEGVAVVGLFGVPEHDLAKLGSAVVDLLSVALHHRANDRHHCLKHQLST